MDQFAQTALLERLLGVLILPGYDKLRSPLCYRQNPSWLKLSEVCSPGSAANFGSGYLAHTSRRGPFSQRQRASYQTQMLAGLRAYSRVGK